MRPLLVPDVLGGEAVLHLLGSPRISWGSEPYPSTTPGTLPMPLSLLSPSLCSALAPAPRSTLASALYESTTPQLGPGPPFSGVPSPMLSSTHVPCWHGLTPVGS